MQDLFVGNSVARHINTLIMQYGVSMMFPKRNISPFIFVSVCLFTS